MRCSNCFSSVFFLLTLECYDLMEFDETSRKPQEHLVDRSDLASCQLQPLDIWLLPCILSRVPGNSSMLLAVEYGNAKFGDRGITACYYYFNNQIKGCQSNLKENRPQPRQRMCQRNAGTATSAPQPPRPYREETNTSVLTAKTQLTRHATEKSAYCASKGSERLKVSI